MRTIAEVAPAFVEMAHQIVWASAATVDPHGRPMSRVLHPIWELVWDLFVNGPEPVGYNPATVPGWDSPTAPAFAALRLTPWRLRVFPGTVLLGQGGEVLTWRAQ